MPQKDRAFVTEIVNGSLRNLYYIDFVIDSVSNVKIQKNKTIFVGCAENGSISNLFYESARKCSM